MSNDKSPTASFGFREVPEDRKQSMVGEVFTSVASRYDLMNDLMSGGVHRLWKDAFVSWLNPQPGMRVVDVAGGTGDIAKRIVAHMRKKTDAETNMGEVVICDINPAMLEAGRKRSDLEQEGAIRWACGNAEALPLPDASMDGYTIAFGIRNVTHIDRALAEARRVLKPGGRFLCLEFSRVEAPILDTLYDKYSFSILPRLGQMVAGDGEAYRYLAESIRKFPPQAQFARLIEQAGLGQVKFRNLMGGIAAMHSGWRL